MTKSFTKILILLGEKNYDDGNLTDIAKARCNKAISILKEKEDYMVLPTGSFGRFNPAEKAHGYYLTKYLINKDILPERILPYTISSNTIEDALCARKIVVDGNFTHVIVITSDYHKKRAEYIFHRIFYGIPLDFSMAETPPESPKPKDESRKLKKTEWVDVPLYTKQEFPKHIYENAASEQKHYDNISLAIVMGFVFLFAYPYLLEEIRSTALDEIRSTSSFKSSPFMISSLLIFCLLQMYKRAAETARTARRIMHWIEIGFGVTGFSTVYPRQSFVKRLPQLKNLVLLSGYFLLIISLFTVLLNFL